MRESLAHYFFEAFFPLAATTNLSIRRRDIGLRSPPVLNYCVIGRRPFPVWIFASVYLPLMFVCEESD